MAKSLASKKIYLTRSLSFIQKPQVLSPNFDYIRYATLELCYEEIISNNVKGSVAELGVYKGDFAEKLNFLFADRKLYLFDTFEGFDEHDVVIEHNKGYSMASQDFSKTSVELVKNKMVHPENCIFRQGVFPESASGIQDDFCFVSLDADLYEPIYQGLHFFYPRLLSGGYIFIHDYNNAAYIGAKNAVVEYCKENKVGFVPIPDSGGTAIITK
jgi:O-methyltransferase